MDLFKYVLEIHFASLLFMAGSAALFLALYIFFAQRCRSPIPHSYLAFFHTIVAKKRRDPLLWVYRKLPYLIALILVLAVGNPVHEEHETRAQQKKLYTTLLDVSGSVVSFDEMGRPVLTFKDSTLNTARLSLMKFTEERKDTSEFFLMVYSDTPYAARYFAGGKEAQVQIGEFLDALPEEIKKLEGTSRAFYLKGTHTAFAFEAAMRYRMFLPADYQESAFILITDLEDTEIARLAKDIDTLVESGLKSGVYIVVLPSARGDIGIASLERSLKHKDSVHIFPVQDQVSLDAALRGIGESQGSPEATIREVARSKSLRMYFVFTAIFLAFVFIGIGELYVRRVP